MATTRLVTVFGCLIALLGGLSACSDSTGDSTGQDETETTGVVDMAPEPIEYDAVFTVSEGPFEIRSSIDEYVGFPDITRLSDGRILVVYREATKHSVDFLGRLVKQIGEPDASVWSEPEVVYDEPGIDDRDPSVATLADGTVAVSYFQYDYQATADGPMAIYQVFYGESQDDGVSFGAPSLISGQMDHPGAGIGPSGLWEDGDGQLINVSATTHPVFEAGGRVIVPVYGGPHWVEMSPDPPRSRVVLASTDDHGETWTEETLAPEHGADLWLQEPAILAVDDDHWILHIRAAEGDSPGNAGAMRQAVTEDGGLTWSDYEAFDFIGQSQYLAQLSNGVLISAFRWYDDAVTTSAVNFIYSMDQGETWSEMITILEPQLEDIGHPTILELDDGRVLIVYYVAGTSIMGIIYDVEVVEIDAA